MTDLVFPTIKKPVYPFKDKPEDNSKKSTFEDGSVQARRYFTRSRKKWTVKWTALPQVQYELLDDFIRNQACFAANSFIWTNPSDNKDYEVYVDDYQGASLTMLGYWDVTLVLAEV